MQPARIVYPLICFFTLIKACAQHRDRQPIDEKCRKEISTQTKTKHLNLFIISKRQKGRFDLATRFNTIRAKLKTLLSNNKFVTVVVKNKYELRDKVSFQLNKHQSKVGTMWFDSHGKYAKGYSLFMLGNDEISSYTLKDSAYIRILKDIADYSDHETKIIIGACYGGATYSRPAIDYRDTTRMDGDLLMKDLGKIFNRSMIYGCESWVMTKPGLFQKRPSVVGYPGRNLFHDICYKPVWENIGKWNEYNAITNELKSSNPVTLDPFGNLKKVSLSSKKMKKLKKRIRHHLTKLQPGLYK